MISFLICYLLHQLPTDNHFNNIDTDREFHLVDVKYFLW